MSRDLPALPLGTPAEMTRICTHAPRAKDWKAPRSTDAEQVRSFLMSTQVKRKKTEQNTHAETRPGGPPSWEAWPHGQVLRMWVENPGGDQETEPGDRDRRGQDGKDTACLAFGRGGASCEEWPPSLTRGCPVGRGWEGLRSALGRAVTASWPLRGSGSRHTGREKRPSVSQRGCVRVCDSGVVRVSHWCTYTVCARVTDSLVAVCPEQCEGDPLRGHREGSTAGWRKATLTVPAN